MSRENKYKIFEMYHPLYGNWYEIRVRRFFFFWKVDRYFEVEDFDKAVRWYRFRIDESNPYGPPCEQSIKV